MTFRHVLWDLDGTLLDTYPATDGSLVAALAGLGAAVPLAEVQALTRLTLDHAVEVLSRRAGLHVPDVHAAYAREYAVRGQQAAPAMPGAAQVMRAVRAAGGLNLLGTHRDREGARWRLEAAGLDALLDDMLCVSDGYARKPDPALFRALLSRHALDARDVLVVGDRELDVQAGRAAGCRTALLLTPGVTVAHTADVELPDLTALLQTADTA
ncbi:HAD family hydrolase [Deinococcus aquiradiocola]|uniref:Haloacid dehalogenase n=1 Tax=Deinococcus aquiradiocola TaxID=393059 RepID=A0A917PEQ0_9DEIO|nr:HAD-IA family hydrolase [Deinococcus aquiradiocola]GGJ73661.1 haloacid dehalogenase [Deinococcus aquiradiocola]